MKKLILILLLAGAAAGGWYWWKTHQAAPAAAGPELVPTQVVRGSLIQAVTSTGRIVSNLDVDIKCKASGEIIKLPFDISDRVSVGNLLVELDPVDEKRAVGQGEAMLAQSQAKQTQSIKNLEIAEKNLVTTRQRVASLITAAENKFKDARTKADRRKDLLEQKLGTQEDYDTAETAAIQAEADLQACRIQQEELKAQEVALDVKKQDIKLAEAQVRSDTISLENARQRLTDTTVLAPMDGVVSARTVQIGTIISSGITNVGGGTTILTLSDLSHIFVLASVDESDIGKVADPARMGTTQPSSRPSTRPRRPPEERNGETAKRRDGDGGNIADSPIRPLADSTSAQSRPAGMHRRELDLSKPQVVNITVDAYPGEKFQGKVVRVATKGVNVTNVVTFEVKIEVTSPNKEKLRPEMTANVQIVAEERVDVLTLPTNAVVRKDGKTVVQIPKENQPAEERTVKVGMTDGNSYEIVSGLNEGDTVLMRKGEADSKWRSDAQRMAGMMGGMGAARRGR